MITYEPKERQDPTAVLKLTNEDLLCHLESLSFVEDTVISKNTKYIKKVSWDVSLSSQHLFMSTYESISKLM